MTSANRGALGVAYTSDAFPTGMVRASGQLQTNWDELLWAALTVGRPNTAYVFRHKHASYHEALFRLSLVRMALEQQTSGGPLFRTEAFKSLDPTEKGAVSYFLGMAVCKLFASRLLATPWLLHLDVFRDQLNPTVLGGRSRPDLVGQDATGAWHAFECKGRSSVPNADDRRKAKAQAQRVVHVNSKGCLLHVGAISYFRQDALVFHWRDPEPEVPEALDPIRVNVTGEMWRFHYEPAVALVVHPERPSLWEARKALDIDVRIHGEILPLLLEGSWAAAHWRARELRDVLVAEGFQADGLRVVAGDSWRTAGQLG